jgi:hypothetical protein
MTKPSAVRSSPEPRPGPCPPAGKPGDFLERPPLLAMGLGSSAVNCLRYFRGELIEHFGDVPPHITLLGTDTTGQQRLDTADMLPEASFLNLADQEHIQERLRRAREDPCVAEWMHPIVTSLALGRGVGSLDPAARFLLEQGAPTLVKRLNTILDQYVPPRRAELASRANAHPRLRSQHLMVSTAGPIDVLYVASLPGGTVGALLYHVALLRDLFRQKGLQGDFTLLATPPAMVPAYDLEARRRLRKTYGRLQELIDLDAGLRLTWPVGQQTIEEAGPFFESTYLFSEPAWGKLDEHHRVVGWLLLQVAAPLGKTWCDRSVDMLTLYRERGPLGQRKFLSLIGMTTIQAVASPDVVGLVEARLGARAVAADPTGVAQVGAKVLDAVGLTTATLELSQLQLRRPILPGGLADPGPFLANAERAAKAEGERKAREEAPKFAQLCHNAATRAQEELQAISLSGMANAAAAATALLQRLQALRHAAQVKQGQLSRTASSPRTPAPDDRLDALVATQQATARAACLGQYSTSLARLIATLEQKQAGYQAGARLCRDVQVACEARLETFAALRPAAQAILDRPTLEEMIDEAVPACTTEVRQILAQALQARTDPERVKADVQAAISQHARPFGRLAGIEAALQAAGERGLVALQAAVAAAEPGIRVDPAWDRSRHSVRMAFLTAPEDHQAAELLRRRGRTVFSAPSGLDAGEITLVTVDFGVEPAALAVTGEALEAYLTDPGEIPPFADRRYEPLADLVVPSPQEWFVLLSIPLHLELHTGVIRYDPLRGFLYHDQPLSQDRVGASRQLLKRTDRPEFLPPFEELAARTEAALVHGRDSEAVLAILRSLEKKLTQHLRAAATALKQVLLAERTAARAVLARYQEQLLQMASHDTIWGDGHRPAVGRASAKDLSWEQSNGEDQRSANPA